jgi:hypothetical protein
VLGERLAGTDVLAAAIVRGLTGLFIVICPTVPVILSGADDGDALYRTHHGALPAADADRLIMFVIPRQQRQTATAAG